MRRASALAIGLKAAALVVLLTLAWAVPAVAHPGHGASTKSTVQAVSPKQAVRQVLAVASLSSGDATVCAVVRAGLSAPSDDSQRSGGLGRVCCGTMCSVAVIELSINCMPMRASHRFRRYSPAETLPHTGMPSLPARPPRTSNIA